MIRNTISKLKSKLGYGLFMSIVIVIAVLIILTASVFFFYFIKNFIGIFK
jgi:hypothetical protein